MKLKRTPFTPGKPKGSPPVPAGREQLLAALRRLLRHTRRQLPHRNPPPAPQTEWEHAAEERLSRIEQQLTSQNRLLLLSIIALCADLIYGVAR